MAPNKILVIRRDNVGDLVCTTPILTALRAAYPSARICALTNSYNAAVLTGNAAVDAVYVYTKAKHRRGGQSVFSIYLARILLFLRLRRERFDVAIVAGSHFSSHGLRSARLTRARRIFGCAPANGKIRLPANYIALPPRQGHEVENVYSLLAPLSIAGEPPRLCIAAPADTVARARKALPPAKELTIGIHLSAREPANQWPVAHFVALIHRLNTRPGRRFVLFWSPGATDDPLYPGDNEKVAAVHTAVRGAAVTPVATPSIQDLIGALALCDRVIACDSGAVHVAAALQKPIVGLYCDAKVTQWRPWRVPHRVVAAATVGAIVAPAVASAFEQLENELTAVAPSVERDC